MKTLQAGTKKYLLIDAKRVERNTERERSAQPVVMVIEVDGETATTHRCTTVLSRDGLRLEYSQHRKLKLGHGITEYAAWVTTGEVFLDAPEDFVPADTTKAVPKASASGKASTTTKTPE